MPIGTSLNQNLPQNDGTYSPSAVSVVKKTIRASDQGIGEIVIGTLPANACIGSDSVVWVKTLFNGTTPVVNVGVAGTPAMFASALALTAVAGVPFDDNLLAAAVPTNAARSIVCTVGGTGSTAGSADIIIEILGS